MNNKQKSWAFVCIQALLLFALLVLKSPDAVPADEIVAIGRAIELIGLVLLVISLYDLRKSLTALPMPVKDGSLQVHGLYRFVRHPMYVAVLILALGIAITSGLFIKYLLVFALLILFHYKAKFEEKLLIKKYPSYTEYMNKTPRFIPKISRKK